MEDLCLVERPSGKEGTDRGRDNRNCANTGDTDRGLDAIGTMGKSIRSKIKRKYRAQRAETVNALGIEEEKVQKKQAVLKGCLEAPAAHTVSDREKKGRKCCGLHQGRLSDSLRTVWCGIILSYF